MVLVEGIFSHDLLSRLSLSGTARATETHSFHHFHALSLEDEISYDMSDNDAGPEGNCIRQKRFRDQRRLLRTAHMVRISQLIP